MIYQNSIDYEALQEKDKENTNWIYISLHYNLFLSFTKYILKIII